MRFHAVGVLLDIEGTTSSIRFVYDVMFPFVRRELRTFLQQNGESADVQLAGEQMAQEAGHRSLSEATTVAGIDVPSWMEAESLRLMDADVKSTGLKHMQGLIWKSGFEGGELRSHIYADVPVVLNQWHEAGIDVRIYSSGSVQAQLLFFRHTEQGDLLPMFRGHYDTNIGAKRDVTSYQRIATEFEKSSSELLFVSDIPDELDAARHAGWQTALCLRPGNAPVSEACQHPQVDSFFDIRIAKPSLPDLV